MVDKKLLQEIIKTAEKGGFDTSFVFFKTPKREGFKVELREVMSEKIIIFRLLGKGHPSIEISFLDIIYSRRFIDSFLSVVKQSNSALEYLFQFIPLGSYIAQPEILFLTVQGLFAVEGRLSVFYKQLLKEIKNDDCNE